MRNQLEDQYHINSNGILGRDSSLRNFYLSFDNNENKNSVDAVSSEMFTNHKKLSNSDQVDNNSDHSPRQRFFSA